MRAHALAASLLAFVGLHCGDEGTQVSSSTLPTTTGAEAASADPPLTSAAETAVAPPGLSAAQLTSSPAPAPVQPQLYYDRLIEDYELKGRTLRELSLMRNWIYARAGNPFRKPWLDEFFRAQEWYKPAKTWDPSKLSAIDEWNATRIAVHDSEMIDKEELDRRAAEVLARVNAGTATKEDDIEIVLLSQRLGRWLGAGKSRLKPTPLQDPSRLDRLLTVEELNEMSRRDLRMLRNAIYARRGRAFENEFVGNYFRSAQWYKPDPAYQDGMLTEVDHKNVAIVRSVEDSLGGPYNENWFRLA